MKSLIIAAILCAVLLGSATAAPISTSPIGSKNLIMPPALSPLNNSRAETKVIVVRHPTQAGNVHQTVSGNFVPSAAHSWIAKGDKRYSLCITTNDNKVACSPLLAASVMTDLELGVIPGKDGSSFVTFKAVPGTKRHGKALAHAAGRFMQRIARMSAHLERRAVSYAPGPWDESLRVGGVKSFADAGGGSCGGTDDDGYDCTGGDGGGDGGGGGGEGDGDSGGCNGQCDYPDGNDNGDASPPPFDPATGEGVDPNAPEVIIVGMRPPQGTEEPPEDWVVAPPPMPTPVIVPIPTNVEDYSYIPVGCIIGPRGIVVCPPPGPNPLVLPKPKPGFTWKWQWSDIQWCKVWNNCDPKASEGDDPKPPAVTPGEKFLAAMDACRAEAKRHMEYCVDMKKYVSVERSNQCGYDAVENYKACEATALDLYNNGQGR
jgi:hypothetical protein